MKTGAILPFALVDYIAAMSPYNFDPEADQLREEFKRAQASGRGIELARANILAFVKRKKAALEAIKKP